MLVSVPAAISRFQRRLRLAAFAGGAMATFAALALGAAGLLLLARFGGGPATLTTSSWPLWLAVAVGAVLGGAVRMRRTRVSAALAAEHLERRLGTEGLLLSVCDGAELDAAWQQRLQARLADVPRVLPVLRWRRLVVRPLASAALLVAMSCLPNSVASAPGAATTVAVERLIEDVEGVAALPAVSAELADELRQAGRELAERAAAGETELWREIDQLDARLDRERRLAGESGDAASAGADSMARGAAARPAPNAAELAAAMQSLAGLEGREGLMAAFAELPPELQAAAQAAMPRDGSIEPAALPDAPAARQQLAAALAQHARELADDPAVLAELAKDLAGTSASDLAEQLASLAQPFAEQPDTGEAGSSEAGEAQQKQQLAAELAKAATEMAELAGGIQQMPEALQAVMAEAAAAAAEAALSAIDPETLLSLLPDDLSQLQQLAESLQGSAEQLAKGAEQAGAPELPQLPQMSAAAKAKLAELAQRLAESSRLALAGGGEQPGQNGQPAAQGAQQGGNQPGAQGAEPGAGVGPGEHGEASGASGAGSGHTALRLTEDTVGGIGGAEMPLPSGDQPADPTLPREWLTVATEKAEPEVLQPTAAVPGRDGATGTGGATWQLRLSPRHREIVRRYFAEKDKR